MAKGVGLEDILTAADAAAVVQGLSFEAGLKLLEELVNTVESGNLSLDRSVVAYERGVALMEHLRGLLSGAEEKLTILQRSSLQPKGERSGRKGKGDETPT